LRSVGGIGHGRPWKKSSHVLDSLLLASLGYYDLHPTQASRGLARVKTERMAGR